MPKLKTEAQTASPKTPSKPTSKPAPAKGAKTHTKDTKPAVTPTEANVDSPKPKAKSQGAGYRAATHRPFTHERRVRVLKMLQKLMAVSPTAAVPFTDVTTKLADPDFKAGHTLMDMSRDTIPLVAKGDVEGMKRPVYVTKAGLKFIDDAPKVLAEAKAQEAAKEKAAAAKAAKASSEPAAVVEPTTAKSTTKKSKAATPKA